MTGPSLDHLRTFVTVVRVGSLTAAARSLGIGQATVSAHVLALEANAGHPLLVRERSGVRATARGAELAREAARHVDALEGLVEPIARPDGARRAVHLGGPVEALSTFVVPAVGGIVERLGVSLHVHFGLADNLLDRLRTGELDVVVSAVRPRVRGVEATAFLDEEFVLVGAPRWAGAIEATPGGAGPVDAPRLLASVPLIAYAEDLPIVRRYWRTVFGRRPDDVDVAVVMPDLRAVLDVVRSGAGMSVLPAYLAEPALRSGDLVVLHEPEVAPLNTVFLATRSGTVQRDATIAALLAELAALAP